MRILPAKILKGLVEGLEILREYIPGMQISNHLEDQLRVFATVPAPWEQMGLALAKAGPIFFGAGIETWATMSNTEFSLMLGYIPIELAWIKSVDAPVAVTTVIEKLKKATDGTRLSVPPPG